VTNISIINVPGYFRLVAEGHAGYGQANDLPEGHDIVCAAVSTLGETAAQCMLELSEEKAIVIREMQIKSGFIDIRVLAKKKAQERLGHIVYTIQTGFELLRDSYPDFVKLELENGVVETEKGL
jgi:uncharacterized protein YsxB (DUF464 family)